MRDDWNGIRLERFRQGLAVELQHESHDPATDVTTDDTFLTGNIAPAHPKEYPDYYDRLAQLEKDAEEHWPKQKPK